jgi:hypothetical protein
VSDARGRPAGSAEDQRPDKYDPEAALRVEELIEFERIELIRSHFEVLADDPTESPPLEPQPIKVGYDVRWQPNEAHTVLGCIITFGTLDSDHDDLRAYAAFRVTYSVRRPTELADYDANQFVWYHAVYSLWPYWREHLDGMVRSANMPSPLMPNLRAPHR